MRWLRPARFLVPTLLALALISARPEPAAFCGICCVRDARTSWVIRGTSVVLWKTHEIAPTPMNEVLAKKSLVPGHAHRWCEAQAVPNPLDESGPPVVESLEFVNAPRVVSFMRDLAEYGDSDSVLKWRDVLLRPQYSYVIDDALRFLLVGFGDRTRFLAWWSTNGFALHNRLRELTEPD
ncbi:MAG: hypothetical protein DMF06_13720 [Verrucomicrobia bacterium]|nr:MAG: hypothetical protein DMF06_13720 [Verrucomicrobiota bacterium]